MELVVVVRVPVQCGGGHDCGSGGNMSTGEERGSSGEDNGGSGG